MTHCQNCKQTFVILPEDTAFYQKMSVPPPTWCPECRAIRRFSFWNERNLYLKKDARTGKEIFSTFPEASPVKIYDHDYWWSDAWNPMDYGREYDFSRLFFEQMYDLALAVPRPSREIKSLVNSDYCNNSSQLKNCYLVFDGDNHENCLYGVGFRNSRDTMDVYSANRLEQCYDLFSCDQNYRVFFSMEADGNHECAFLRNCENCSNCFGCVGLNNKQYHIWNKPCTKEDYERKIQEYDLGSYQNLQKLRAKAHAFWLAYPYRFAQIHQSENAIGDYIYKSKNIYHSFEAFNVEDLRYCQNVVNHAKDSMDYTSWGDESQLMYESLVSGESCYNARFCVSCWPGIRDSTYCIECHSSADLFGCVGLNKKQYCILNKQYSKEEYERLVPKIIAHMNEMPYTDAKGRVYKFGEFFPPEHSPIAYNESVGQDYRPESKETALANGFLWRDPNQKEYEITMKAEDMPDHVKDAPDTITKELIQCVSCKKAYRIAAMELRYLRQWGIALPRKCFGCRHLERVALRNPFRWYHRACMCDRTNHFHGSAKCPNEFETTFAPDRPHTVYCEQCYQAEFLS